MASFSHDAAAAGFAVPISGISTPNCRIPVPGVNATVQNIRVEKQVICEKHSAIKSNQPFLAWLQNRIAGADKNHPTG
jgi:hypothetical protein